MIGMEKSVNEKRVRVMSMVLSGRWGSCVSHKGGPALNRLPKRCWSRVKLNVGEAVTADQVASQDMRRRVLGLRERP